MIHAAPTDPKWRFLLMGPSDFISTITQGKPDPIYFLRGPDRFLQEECHRTIVDSIPEGDRQWCLAEIEFEAGRLRQDLEAAQQMPMLGSHIYLIFSDTDDFKSAGDDDTEALADYLKHASPFATVTFSASAPDRRRKFIQLLEKKSSVVEIRSLDVREAGSWAVRYAGQAGVELDPKLAEEVAGKFEISNDSRGDAKASGVNLLWMRTELEKLLVAKPDKKRWESADLDMIETFREEREIGKLLKAIADRDCGKALEFLRELLGSKIAETLILWCIGDLFRQALKNRGFSGGRGNWPGRPANPYAPWEIAKTVAQKYPREEMHQAIRAVRRTDLGIKSSWKDSRILLEFLVWQVIVGRNAMVPTIGEELPSPTPEA
jgi:DNA polymerase III delta subunit